MIQLVILLVVAALGTATAAGGERAFFTTPQMAPGVIHRQDVCDRYYAFSKDPQADWRDGLKGLQLHAVLGSYPGSYFNYNEETGIDSAYPGLAAVLLDELARRGQFTWRDSFAVYTDPAPFNSTWDELLMWSIDTYDISIDWWGYSLERMAMGVGFLEGFLDSSLILISKEQAFDEERAVNIWNWLRPYDAHVWAMTVTTILLSAIVYQILEWFADERLDRSMWEWWQENTYRSFINFTQAYEYQPSNFATRLFGISMAIWALVMTATYTANLASLLVDRRLPPPVSQSIEEAVLHRQTICVWEGTFSDSYLWSNYKTANRVRKSSPLEMYQGLQDGECDFLIDNVEVWNQVKSIQKFNPQCDLYWVGTDRIIHEASAGFALKPDSGTLCTGFIQSVLNIHMLDMIEDGFLENAWTKEHSKTADMDCNAFQTGPLTYRSSEEKFATRYRNLAREYPLGRQGAVDGGEHWQRRLKSGGKGAAGGAVAASPNDEWEDNNRRLTVEQMIGTFVFHWGLMSIALCIASADALSKKYRRKAGKSLSGAPTSQYQIAGGTPDSTSSISITSDAKCELQALKKQLSLIRLHMQRVDEMVSRLEGLQPETKFNEDQHSSINLDHDPEHNV